MQGDRRGTGGIYIRRRNLDDCVILSLEGSISKITSPDLTQSVVEILETKHLRKIIFHFLPKSRITEEGLGIVNGVLEKIRKAGGRLVIVDEDNHLWRLRRSGLSKKIQVADSVEQACKLLSEEAN